MDISEDSTLRLWGDIQFVNNPILVEIKMNTDTKDRLIKIMVFEGGSEQAPILYDKWLAGLIKESIPDNNIRFSTKFVQERNVTL